MYKGIFSIPVYKSSTNIKTVLDEVYKQVIDADKWGINEAFLVNT